MATSFQPGWLGKVGLAGNLGGLARRHGSRNITVGLAIARSRGSTTVLSGQGVWAWPRPADRLPVTASFPGGRHGHHHRRPGKFHPDRAVLRGPRERRPRRLAGRLAAGQPVLGTAGSRPPGSGAPRYRLRPPRVRPVELADRGL